MGFLLWAALGVSVGYVAAQRRDFSTAIGVLAGLALGRLAVVLFFVPSPSRVPGNRARASTAPARSLLTPACVTIATHYSRAEGARRPGASKD